MSLPHPGANARQGASPLDPAVIKLIDALARAQAKEDYDRDDNYLTLPPK